MKVAFYLLISLLAFSAASTEPVERPLTYRWFYIGSYLGTKEWVDHYTALFPWAAQAGYNGILLAGIDTNHLTPEYRALLRTFAEEAAQYHLDIYPAVMATNSGSVVVADPNLAEGLPARNAPFVVRGREAVFAPEAAVALANGSFEQAEGNRPVGWSGKQAFVDTTVAHSGQASLRTELQPDYAEGGRANQVVKVQPFRQYHLSFWAKSEGFQGRAEWLVINGTGKPRAIGTFNDRLAPTQDWTQYHILFNSLEWETVLISFGVWGSTEGQVWWDDVVLEEAGLLNPLLRAGTPLLVSGEDGTLYEPGRDFEPLVGPPGAWPGYRPSLALQLTENSRLREGTRLRVSYYHPIFLAGGLTACLSEPKTYDILRQELVVLNDLFHPKGFFMWDDEMRVANWDETCQKGGLTPGQQLAEKVRRCVQMIREIRPDAEIFDWSDMFDPWSNAVGDYYAVNGSWAGSWEGLPPEVIIANWSPGNEPHTSRFFAERGHKQILAGYYDWDHDGAGMVEWLEKTRDVPGIVGVMYTTWRNRYEDLEAFARAVWGGK